MKTTKIITLATGLAMIFSTSILLAQGPPPPSGPGSGAPVDGGLILLVIGAAALGYRKLRKGNARINSQIAYYESVLNDPH